MDEVLHEKEARLASPSLNIEHKMSVKEYKELTPYAKDLEVRLQYCLDPTLST